MAKHVGDNMKQVHATEIDCIVSTQLTVHRQIVPIINTFAEEKEAKEKINQPQQPAANLYLEGGYSAVVASAARRQHNTVDVLFPHLKPTTEPRLARKIIKPMTPEKKNMRKNRPCTS
ncbi:hypothetical protein T4D_7225 [Trichinella pseudospiralis]|uniref:Uncharacterized protein n=1 Tax=Trichinella pseudospiralis TaxID=6337 RepID=A0A0V1G4B4_TRIPS|nr:hypothetical protein T4D_7225 [Trichinella pseudospiralis]